MSRVHHLFREQLIDQRSDAVFGFFARAANLERITPPWLAFSLLTPEPVTMDVGTVIDYRLRLHGIPLRWTSRIELWEPGRAFVDVQVKGPYRVWHHRHEFQPVGAGTLVRDHVTYALPFGPLGEVARAAFVERDLGRIFAHRHRAVAQLLA